MRNSSCGTWPIRAPASRRWCSAIRALTLPSWPRNGSRRSRRTHPDARLGARAVRIKLTEIFHSLQGEADTAGVPTVFVRLTGCPLRCQYCDTAYAFHGGEWWELEAILARVAELGTRYVCVTGGEPLAQKNCVVLLK